MIEHDSRYYALETAVIQTESGSISYKKRRFLPRSQSMRAVAGVFVTEGDRLDLIAQRVWEDPNRAWQICDANDAMNPLDLTRVLGTRLRIAEPNLSVEGPAPGDGVHGGGIVTNLS